MRLLGYVLFPCFILLSSCVAPVIIPVASLDPGAHKVRVSNTAPPKSCRYLGHVTVEQPGRYQASDQEVQTGAFNMLRNKGYEKNGNYIELLASTPVPGHRHIILTGVVYRCS